MYILLSGYPPFDGDDDSAIIEKVRIGKYNFDDRVWNTISSEAKILIRRMLTVDYKQRPYAKDTTQDDWFSKAPSKPIDKEAMKAAFASMQKFNVSQKLQQATLCIMVNNMISSKE